MLARAEFKALAEFLVKLFCSDRVNQHKFGLFFAKEPVIPKADTVYGWVFTESSTLNTFS